MGIGQSRWLESLGEYRLRGARNLRFKKVGVNQMGFRGGVIKKVKVQT